MDQLSSSDELVQEALSAYVVTDIKSDSEALDAIQDALKTHGDSTQFRDTLQVVLALAYAGLRK